MNRARVIAVEKASDGSRSATVFDVAREVGYSIATVSRALNQPDRVNVAIRERIIEVVAQLGYVPNASAAFRKISPHRRNHTDAQPRDL